MRRCFRRAGRGVRRGAVLGVLLTALVAVPLPAQEGGEAGPLTKADVIRLLTAGPDSDAEVARTVRSRCISFRLTDRDRADFRDLGATDAVLTALESCSARRSALTVSAFPDDTLYGLAGDSVSVIVTARRGDRRAAGVPLRLRGAGGAPTVTTDDRGIARFTFRAARQSGPRTLEVTSPDEQVSGPATIPLVVRPARPAEVRVWPAVLTLGPDGDEVGEVLALVTDRFGNSVPGAPVVARDSTESGARVVASSTTDRRGETVLRIPAKAVEGRAEFGIWARGERVGSMPVRRAAEEAPVVASAPEPAEGGDSAAAGETAEEPPPATQEPDEDTVAEAGPPPSEEASAPAGEEPASEAAPRTAPRSLPALRREAAESPGDPSAWMELAAAWRQAGRPLEARQTLLRAREVAPEGARDSVDGALSGVLGLPPGLRLTALGGSNVGRGGAAGLRYAEARVRLATFLEAWGRYDRSLGRRLPALLRGPDLLDAYWTGLEVEWGTPARVVTLVEAGRREYRDVDLAQNLLRVEQGVRVPTDLGHVRVRGGGVVGRWFDRDDWLGYVRASVPVALWADVKPSFWVGETVGTDLRGVGREPGREVRGVLGVELRPAPRVRIEPSAGYGHVDADLAEASGPLWQGGLTVSVPLGSAAGLEVVARHQSPPGGDSFTVLAGGLRLRLP